MNTSSSESKHRVDQTEEVKRAYNIPEFCKRFSVGRTRAYEEIRTRRLRALKIGRRTIITNDDAESWLAGLPRL